MIFRQEECDVEQVECDVQTGRVWCGNKKGVIFIWVGCDV